MPKAIEVTAKVPAKEGRAQIGPFTIKVQSGKDLDEAVQMFSKEAILSQAESNWVVTLQSNMRSGMLRGETQEQLQARLGSAKMGVAQAGARVDPVQAYLAAFASATPEKQKAMLAELQARAAKK